MPSRLKRAFEEFINKHGYHQGARLLFYYSGHGHSDGDDGFLVPSDAPDPAQDEVGFYRKALDMNQVMAWARRIRAKHALFMFDSCFSGAVFKAKNLPGKEERYIRRATHKPVRQFITAGGAGETVPARSTFTPAFVDALRERKGDLNKDGYVTGNELGVYLSQEVPRYENQNPQYGKIKEYRLAQGDFVFFLPAAASAPVIAPPPPRLLGHLQVNVTVPDVQVYVNDRPVGQASTDKPLNLPNLPVGKVRVRTEVKDHEPLTRWVEIHQGRWSQPVFSLLPVAPASASLTVRSNVHGDSVYINDDYKGSTRLDLELAPGEYRVKVSKGGYKDWEQAIRLEAEERATVTAQLVVVSGPVEKPSIEIARPSGTRETPSQGEEWREPVTGMAFVWVPKGCFQMGSNEGRSDRPVHEVCLDGFWMGKYEVTQGQWKNKMGSNPLAVNNKC